MAERRPDRLAPLSGAAGEFRFRQPRPPIGNEGPAVVRRRMFERNFFAVEKRIRAATGSRVGGNGTAQANAGDAGPGRKKSAEAGKAFREAGDRVGPFHRSAV